MTSKKEQVKEVVRTLEGVWTIERLMWHILGGNAASRYRQPMFEVSKSTVYRALREMDSANEIDLYFKYGHCYDILRFKKVK